VAVFVVAPGCGWGGVVGRGWGDGGSWGGFRPTLSMPSVSLYVDT